ncbi:MAG: hypothetical protein AVO35_07250 [Candidatus Aegiribacteria sp. MLS_C]|nr:MAG: hypothetical protein AVO35_07250 [Candidatus Aegiribacteria sp. MLS_C]
MRYPRLPGLVLAAIVLTATASCTRGVERPSVVLVIIDTLRADHLSCYGYRRDTSPVLDSLAEAGVMMENVTAQSSWTLPATASIMSGQTPVSHGAGMDVPTGRVFGMDPEMPLLAMVMNDNGYATAGFFNVYLLSGDFGFHRGFDLFECRDDGNGKADSTVSSAIRWLQRVPDDRPFLLVVHLFDPHDPYDPPRPFDTLYGTGGSERDGGLEGDGGLEREIGFWKFTEEGAVADTGSRNRLEGLYDGEIAWVDGQLGRLMAQVRDLEREGTLVVVTADHGEEFLEHGYVGHGRTLYPEITSVPLIISGTDALRDVHPEAMCGQVDITPTILDYCGLEMPVPVRGRSLFGLEHTGTRMLSASGINTGSQLYQVSVRTTRKQLIWNARTDSAETYRLDLDPLAQEPLPADSALLDRALFYWSTPRPWEPDMLESWEVSPVLRDLGYID